MKIPIFTLCDYAQNNQGKLTIIGTFNKVFSKVFPFVYPASFCIVAKISSSKSLSTAFEISSIAPDGNRFIAPFKGDLQITVPANSDEEQSADFIININTPEFKLPGTYSFILRVGEETISQDLYLETLKQ